MLNSLDKNIIATFFVTLHHFGPYIIEKIRVYLKRARNEILKYTKKDTY